MDQPIPFSRHRQGSDNHGSSHRRERRAAVAQMMAQNREGLGMKVIAVIAQRYGVLPRELWDLNSISDMGAGRGITYHHKVPEATFESITRNDRYSIINLTINRYLSEKMELPNTLRRLKIMVDEHDYPLDLPESLQELVFGQYCRYRLPLVLPGHLQKLALGDAYNLPMALPPALLELELGSGYRQSLSLPKSLKQLAFAWSSEFNLPLILPGSLVSIRFNKFYNQPTLLPTGIEELMVGSTFTQDLTLPNSLRKIDWWCDTPIVIPEGVSEVNLFNFNQPVVFPASVKKVTLAVGIYSHLLIFPAGLEELEWRVANYEGVVLPERLQRLTWMTDRTVDLPSALRELVIGNEAPLILPEGLLKVTFDRLTDCHYNLPESVQEVTLKHSPGDIFTHPTTLQHLIVSQSDHFLDLSSNTIHSMTIEDCHIRIWKWPQGLEELEFTVDAMCYPMRVPKGCEIVGEVWPRKVRMQK